MPYITEQARDEILSGRPPETPGELNFCITSLLGSYLERFGLSYQSLAEARIACLDAALELYAQVGRPYEDGKIRQNGHVLPEDVRFAAYHQ